MDIGTALIGLAIFVVCAVFVYLLGVYSIQENTYEQAVAEQKKRAQQEIKNSRAIEKKKREKKKIKKSKQQIQVQEQVTVSEDSQEEVVDSDLGTPAEEEPAPQPVQQQTDKPKVESKASKKKKEVEAPKSKPKEQAEKKEEIPEKQNKQEANQSKKSKVQKEESKAAEQPQEQKQAAKQEQQVSKKKKNKETPEVVTVEVPMEKQDVGQEKREVKTQKRELAIATVEESSSTASSSPTPEARTAKLSKRQRKVKMHKELEEQLSSGMLIPVLRNAVLDNTEIQTMIDILLNKQYTGQGDWKAPGQRVETVAELKKKLEEKENALNMHYDTIAKLKNLRIELNNEKLRNKEELNTERRKFERKEKMFNDAVMKKDKELMSLSQSFKRMNEQHAAESERMKSQLQQLSAKVSEGELSRLADEKEHLKIQLEKATHQSSQQEARVRELEAVCNQHAAQLSSEIKKTQELSTVLKNKDDELNHLRIENEALAAQVSSAQDRPQAEGQEELSADEQVKADAARIAQLCEQLSEFETAALNQDENIERLLEKLGNKDKLVHLECNLAQQRLHNQELDKLLRDTTHEKSQLQTNLKNKLDLVDKLKSECDAQVQQSVQQVSRLAEKDTQIATLINDIEMLKRGKQPSGEVDEELQKQKQVSDELEEELQKQKEKNNELRSKNWEAMEALGLAENRLSKAEKVSDEKIVEARKDEGRKFKKLLETICSHLKVDTTNEELWMQEFCETLRKEMESNVEKYADAKERLEEALERETELQARLDVKDSELAESARHSNVANEKLLKEVNHYRTVLSQTESILSTLQSSVSEEEQKWKVRITTLTTENEQLVQEKRALEQEIQAAQEAASEMQEKLVELQKKLEGEEEEKKDLAAKYEEATRLSNEFKSQVESLSGEAERCRECISGLREEEARLSEKVRLLQHELDIVKEGAVNGTEGEGVITNGEQAQSDEVPTKEKRKSKLLFFKRKSEKKMSN